MKSFLDTNEVAMFLGRSPKAIRKLVERGQLPHRRLGRRVIFVRTEWQEGRKQNSGDLASDSLLVRTVHHVLGTGSKTQGTFFRTSY